jgi:hypothetical protein
MIAPDIRLPRILHADSEGLKDLPWKPYERKTGVLVAVRMPFNAHIPAVGDRQNLDPKEGDYLVIGTDRRPYVVEGEEWDKLYKPL